MEHIDVEFHNPDKVEDEALGAEEFEETVDDYIWQEIGLEGSSSHLRDLVMQIS